MPWNRSQTFQQNAQFSGAGPFASTQVTLGSAVAVGDSIVLETTVAADPTTLSPTVTDQLGNTYTRLTLAQGGQLFDSLDAQGTDAWWCIVAHAGTPTIVYTPHSTSQRWIAIKGSHFTGSDASSTMRDSKGALQTNPGTGANAIATASVGAASGDLLWGGSGNPGQSFLTEAAGTGFTASTIDATTGSIDEWKTATGAGAVTFTDATNGGGSVFQTFGIAITPAGAGSAPNLSAQTVGSVTAQGGTPAVTTDVSTGTAYMVIVPDGDSPSVAQIKAGQNSGGGAAIVRESRAVSASGVQTFTPVAGLSTSTPYDCWFVHTDASSNDSTAVKADFTTSAPPNSYRRSGL